MMHWSVLVLAVYTGVVYGGEGYLPEEFAAVVKVEALGCGDCVRRVVEVARDGRKKAKVRWVEDFENVEKTVVRRWDLGREYETKNVCLEDGYCEKKCIRAALSHTPPIEEDCPSHTITTNPNGTLSSVSTPTMRWTITYLSTSTSSISFTIPHSYEPKTLCKVDPTGLPYIRLLGGLLVL